MNINSYIFYYKNIDNLMKFNEILKRNIKILKLLSVKNNINVKIIININYKNLLSFKDDIVSFDYIDNFINNESNIISYNSEYDIFSFNYINFIIKTFNDNNSIILYKYYDNNYYNIISNNENFQKIKNNKDFFNEYELKKDYSYIFEKNVFEKQNNIDNLFIDFINDYINIDYINTYNLNNDNFFLKIKELFNDNITNKLKIQKIPKILHKICLNDNLLSEVRKNINNFQKENTDWECIIWDSKKIKKLKLHNLHIFNELKTEKYRIDLLKYEILKQYGGVYIDLDIDINQKNISDINNLLQYEFVISFNENITFSNNIKSFLEINDDIIMSVKNNKIINDIIFYMINFNESNHTEYLNNLGSCYILHHIKYNTLCFDYKNISILPINFIKKFFKHININNSVSKMFNLKDLSKYNVNNNQFFIKLLDLYSRNIRNSNNIKKIPKIIHQIWLGGKLPDQFKNYCDSWKKYNPDWTYILWDDEKIKQLNIKNKLLYDSLTNLAFKSDLLRYEILYQYGGLYVDTDFECYKSFNDLIHYEFISGFYFTDFVIDINNDAIDLSNAIIACIPKHKIIYNIINNLQHFNDNNMYDYFKKLGPTFFYHNIKNIIYSNDKICKDMLITPQNYFYSLSHKDIHDNTYIINENDKFLYAIHWFSTTWSKFLK